jgi:hypothetical protein
MVQACGDGISILGKVYFTFELSKQTWLASHAAMTTLVWPCAPPATTTLGSVRLIVVAEGCQTGMACW